MADHLPLLLIAVFAIAVAVAIWLIARFVLRVVKAERADRAARHDPNLVFHHPTLGLLCSEYRGLWGTTLDTAVGSLAIYLDGIESQPDDAHLALVERVLPLLPSVAERARAFLQESGPSDVPSALTPFALICQSDSPSSYVLELVSESDDPEGVWGVRFESDQARDFYRDD